MMSSTVGGATPAQATNRRTPIWSVASGDGGGKALCVFSVQCSHTRVSSSVGVTCQGTKARVKHFYQYLSRASE